MWNEIQELNLSMVLFYQAIVPMSTIDFMLFWWHCKSRHGNKTSVEATNKQSTTNHNQALIYRNGTGWSVTKNTMIVLTLQIFPNCWPLGPGTISSILVKVAFLEFPHLAIAISPRLEVESRGYAWLGGCNFQRKQLQAPGPHGVPQAPPCADNSGATDEYIDHAGNLHKSRHFNDIAFFFKIIS